MDSESTDGFSERTAPLRNALRESFDLNSAISVLSWDQLTYMPPGGGAARGEVLATLAKLAHEKATAPEIGHMLDALEPWAETLPYESDDAALVRVARRDYEQKVRIPAEFTAEYTEHFANTYEKWAVAKPENDFSLVEESLKRSLDITRQYADYFPGYEHPADPLIDLADFGMKASTIRPLFAELQQALTPLVEAIASQPPADDSPVRRHYPRDTQWAFGEAIARDFGYDFNRGRQDVTLHPFCTTFSSGDVRITTRIDEDVLDWGLMSTLHETGHALYEQGVDARFDRTSLGGGTSAGVHESQSRTWENLVGRSRGFWKHYLPKLKQAFPGVADDVSVDQFYRAINKVERSFIRTEADEVTYNLHVIIRFGLELEMLEGRLEIHDLPEAWRARYQEALGVTPPTDTLGVLQDVHWYGGPIGGGFQGYTLGNILSAQFFNAAVSAHPQIPGEIGAGKFDTLHTFLREKIYQHGLKFTTAELVQRVTGGALSIEPYIAYLKNKYGELYTL